MAIFKVSANGKSTSGSTLTYINCLYNDDGNLQNGVSAVGLDIPVLQL